jgi:purine-cytosine permease-like protein
MPNELPGNDPRKIWQDQPTERIKMSLDDIRRKAQKLHAKARMAAIAWIGIGIFLSAAFGLNSAHAREMLPRVGWGVLSLWGLYGAWQAYQWIWPGRLAADATLATSLDFYRKELERQRDYGRQIWRRSGVAAAFLGAALVVAPGMIQVVKTPALLPNVAPFFVLLFVWLVSFLVLRARKQQKLQQEIDELNAMERENR